MCVSSGPPARGPRGGQRSDPSPHRPKGAEGNIPPRNKSRIYVGVWGERGERTIEEKVKSKGEAGREGEEGLFSLNKGRGKEPGERGDSCF